MAAFAPDAVAAGGPPPGAGGPPPGGMAALAAALGAGPGGPTDAGGLPPGLSEPGAGGPAPADTGGGDTEGSDLLSGMNSTDHIRAAIKHLMMAMTESGDDEESAGIGKGMNALHALLAGKAKNAKAVTAAGGTPGA